MTASATVAGALPPGHTYTDEQGHKFTVEQCGMASPVGQIIVFTILVVSVFVFGFGCGWVMSARNVKPQDHAPSPTTDSH